jgi:glycosyltransferase involved in cell wall biosynthesis
MTAPTRTLMIIPALDEELALPKVLADLRATLPDVDVVVVDDGSTDRTAQVAREGGAVVLSLPYNLGIGGALRTGFRYAVDAGYDRGVQFDADGQHDASEVATLLQALEDGADMVIGNRFGGTSQSYELGRVRAGAMGFMRVLVRQFSGKHFVDTSSGFRAFNRDVLEYFARNYPFEYLESVEALLLASGAGFRIDEVPVQMHNREVGRPSTRRLRLLYHYLRLLLVITVSATSRKRAADARAQRRTTRTAAPVADGSHAGASDEVTGGAPQRPGAVPPATRDTGAPNVLAASDLREA